MSAHAPSYLVDTPDDAERAAYLRGIRDAVADAATEALPAVLRYVQLISEEPARLDLWHACCRTVPAVAAEICARLGADCTPPTADADPDVRTLLIHIPLTGPGDSSPAG